MLYLVLILVNVVLAWWFFRRGPSDLPPAPGFRLPILGHILQLDKDFRRQFTEWRRCYGDIFCFYLGSKPVVVLNGFQVIKEALVKHADAFSARPRISVTDIITTKGIVFNSGPSWKEQRKVTTEILRSLGMGKQKFAENVKNEIKEFLREVSRYEGRPADLTDLITVSVSNNICIAIFARRFDYNCSQFSRYLELLKDNFDKSSKTSLLNAMPWLRWLPGDLFHIKALLRNTEEMKETFLLPAISERKDRCLCEDDSSEDFIEAYLHQIRKMQASGKISTTINEESLLWVVMDLFIAGTETISTSLHWILLYLIHHPEVQDKCFKEIQGVLGLTALPDTHHRACLTYVEATIMESMRLANIAAMSIPHGVTESVLLRGYRIPPDAIVMPNLFTVLHDPAVWGQDADRFRPERFLDSSGALIKKEEFIPFGMGRRTCPGDRFARLQLFLYVTSLIQRFRLLPEDDGGELPSLRGNIAFVHSAPPFCLRAVPRT